jgi:membrane protease YdiL (CAAX protease family)
MDTNGSASPPPATPLQPARALIVAAAGVMGMASTGAFVAGLGLRGIVAIGTLLLALPALAVVSARPELRRSVLGRAVSARTLGLTAALGAMLWVASIGLMELQSLAFPPTPEYLDAFRQLHAALAPRGPLDALVSVLVIAVLPGFCEELVVRGIVLPSLARPLGGVLAVVVSALLFAAMHFDPYRFFFTLAVGLGLGLVRLRTGSLWPPVVAHVTLNTLTFAVAPLVDDPSQPYQPQPLLGLACLVAGTALATPLLWLLGRRAGTDSAA